MKQIRKISYVCVTCLFFILMASICNIQVEKAKLNKIINTISSEEFNNLGRTGCHTENDEFGNTVYVPDEQYPIVYLPPVEEEINCIEVIFNKPLSSNITTGLYYRQNGENFDEANSKHDFIGNNDNSVRYILPVGNYEEYMLSISGKYTINSVNFGIANVEGKSDFTYTYHLNFIICIVMILMIFILMIFEEKYRYFAAWKELLHKEITLLKSLEKKHELIIRLLSDAFKILYILLFIILLLIGTINKSLIVTFFIASFLVLIISVVDFIINKKDCAPAKLFLIISLTICSMLSYCLPVNTVLSWDDEIHYYRSTQLKLMLYGGEYTKADENLKQYLMNCPQYIASPQETCLTLIYDDQQIIDEDNRPFVNLYQYIGYLPAATTMFICDIFNINFVSMIVLSKFSNALVYSIIIYLGMKKLKSGQYILSSVALMPTCLFLASVFSYDYWVTAFTMYSIAYLISELQQPGKNLTLKDIILMLGSMLLGCGPKAIYFALLLPFLLIQKEKFSGRFNKKKYVVALISVACLIAGSFALPMLFHGVGSDLRGGSDVNGPEQIKFILNNPLEYSKILINFIKDYISIENIPDWFNFYFYLGQNTTECSTISVIIMALCAFWDKSMHDKFNNFISFKIITFVTLFVQTALFSTALYISYTPVASQLIGGVQGRYAFPMLFPFLYCLGSVHTRTDLNSRFINGLVFGGLSLNIIWYTYSIYIKQIIT